MKTSTEIASAATLIGEEKAVEYIAKAGFDAWDFSMFEMARYNKNRDGITESDHPLFKSDYLAFARRLKNIGENCGITCNQSHAPFPTCGEPMRPYLFRAIECTAEAGGEYCIIHPGNNLSPEENAEMFFDLLPFAKDCGVKIATENMWNWNGERDEASPAACSDEKSFNAHLDAVGDPYLVACLDIGHAEMRGLNTSAEKMILSLGKRLKALHLHDNDRHHDSHALPFTMDIDFKKVTNALKKIGYDGYFTLEADTYLSAFTPETAFSGIQNMARAAKKLADMFETADQ